MTVNVAPRPSPVARRRNVAAVQLDDPMRDGEAEPESLRAALAPWGLASNARRDEGAPPARYLAPNRVRATLPVRPGARSEAGSCRRAA